MGYIASWSGGKDSCLACYKAMLSGYDIDYLVNFISKEYRRVSFHGTEAGLIQLQARSIGVPLRQQETTRDGYEKEFKEAIRPLISRGAEGMIFGDIYLQEHRDWTERVCAELGIEAVEPLWGRDTEDVLSDFIDAGFQAVVVSAQRQAVDAEWPSVGGRLSAEDHEGVTGGQGFR